LTRSYDLCTGDVPKNVSSRVRRNVLGYPSRRIASFLSGPRPLQGFEGPHNGF